MSREFNGYLKEGRSLEALIGATGMKTRHLTTADQLIAAAKDLFEVEGHDIPTVWKAVSDLGRGGRRRFAQKFRKEGVKPKHSAIPPGQDLVWIDYTNWQGKRANRLISPIRIRFERNSWHVGPNGEPEAQWFLIAFDHNKAMERSFALKDIHATVHATDALTRSSFPREPATQETTNETDSSRG